MTHRRLKVYEKALAFWATVERRLMLWSRHHSVRDQLERAAQSLVLNLAQGSRLRSAASKVQALDYSVGSALESAAALDVAMIKQLIEASEAAEQKANLWEITVMLISLRKAWQGSELHEDSGSGGEIWGRITSPLVFHHERLDVYRVSLDFFRWLLTIPEADDRSNPVLRRIDKAATGLPLCIAEGNGRYSRPDTKRFLNLASAEALKASTYLDLWARSRAGSVIDVEPGQQLLLRVESMLDAMIGW